MQPVELPLLELIPLLPSADLELETCAAATDLVIAVSPSAVGFGGRWWPGVWPPACVVAGVGGGTARAWRGAGATEVIEPQGDGDSEALLAHPALQSVSGQRIVILRGEGGRDLLGPTLKRRGATVAEWLCYRRQAPADLASKLVAVLNNSPDAWVVTSSEALAHLEAVWPDGLARSAPLFAPHPRIADAAKSAGWMTILSQSGDAGLMAALRTWFDASDHE